MSGSSLDDVLKGLNFPGTRRPCQLDPIPRETDPRTLGSKCDQCALGSIHRKLGTWNPVLPEIKEDAKYTAVAERPGPRELEQGYPLIGASGRELERVLKLHHIDRSQVNLDNAFMCGLPEGQDLKYVRARIKRDNNKRIAKGLSPLLDPADACRPHLMRTIRHGPCVLALGKEAYKTIARQNAAIKSVRGAFVDAWSIPGNNGTFEIFRENSEKEGMQKDLLDRIPGAVHLRIVPTVQPAFVLRKPANRLLLERDVERWKRWLHNELKWEDYEEVLIPTYEQLFSYLYQEGHSWHAADLETDGKNSLSCGLRCFGLGTPEGPDKKAKAVLIPFMSIRGGHRRPGEYNKNTYYDPLGRATGDRFLSYKWGEMQGVSRQHQGEPWYTDEEGDKILQLLCYWLVDQNQMIVGQNFYNFDNPVLMRLLLRPFGISKTPGPIMDLTTFARANFSEMNRDLHTTGTIITDVPNWKASADERKVAVDPRTDMELWLYCVHGSSPIQLSDGSSLPIKELVERFCEGESFEVQGLYETAQVIEVHQNENPCQQWVRVDTSQGSVTATPDHKFYVWSLIGEPLPVEARNLKEGNQLLQPDGSPTTVLRVDIVSPIEDSSTRYCLTTSSGNFTVSNCVISNCNVDNIVAGRCAEPLWNGAVRRKQMSVLGWDTHLQGIAAEMRELGLRVDEEKRSKWEEEHQERADRHISRITDIVGDSSFNPNSSTQLKKLLYEDWQMPILNMTDTGDASTDSEALRQLRIQGPQLGFTSDQRDFIEELVRHRAVSKIISTYLKPLRPWNDYRKGSDGKISGGLTMPDGRVHPYYNVHCGDKYTEILTKRGWVLFPDLKDTDEVAQWDGSNHEISFVVPNLIHRDHHNGPMYRMENEALDHLVTPGHRMPLVHQETLQTWEYTAETLPKLNTPWFTAHGGHWNGGKGLPLTQDQIELLARSRPSKADRELSSRGRSTLRDHRKLLERMRIPFETCRNRKTKKTSLHFQLPRYLAPYKTLGAWVYQLDRGQIDYLLSLNISTSSEEDLGWIQSLYTLSSSGAFLVGGKLNVHKKKSLHGWNSPTKVWTEHYEGYVYSVNVPTSWVVVRRNGKVSITGNTPKTGRISSSGPNAQNIPKFLRALMIPWYGNVYVGADYDQLELRIFASMAGIVSYLKVLENDGDPHSQTAMLIYEDEFLKEFQASSTPEQWAKYLIDGIPMKPKGKVTEVFGSLRTLAKTFIYAVLYGGTSQTVYQSVASAEHPDGRLMFPDMQEEDIAKKYDNFMKNAPEIKKMWHQLWAQADRYKGVYEPVGGRRRDFAKLDRKTKNEVLNHPIQASGAMICEMGLVGIRRYLAPYSLGPFTGIANQCHDAVTTEVPERDAWWVAELIEEQLTYENQEALPGVIISAEADIAMSWDKAA